MTTVRLLVVSESTSTASTVGCHCQLAQIGTLGVTEGEPDGVRPRDREQYTQRRQRYNDYSCEYEVIKLGIRRLGDGGVRGRVANRGREDTTGGDGEE